MPCVACKRQVPTAFVHYQQNIGMLVVRSRRSVSGNMCKQCSSKYFKQLTGLTLLTGWWGMISLIVNPIFIISNIAAVSKTARLKDGPAAPPVMPAATGQPPIPPQPATAAKGERANPYRQVWT